jgi:hypothetical protein
MNTAIVVWLALCAFFGFFGPPEFGPAFARWGQMATITVVALVGSGVIAVLGSRVRH